ncbi:histone deacetylase [Parvibium lacunae]|uniref:Histone deacetylase n=1 Tax=Parvibium lacunae TaxID=1888893 RepID=A0A368L865_9BURK|nr:histone deacetylase [Parvibium lacunae]RCS59855.1 histone deacetylase [Parvibium lacunae]
MQAYYCDHFVLPLPDGHRFPMDKYRLLRLAVGNQLPEVKLLDPPAASLGQLALAHDPAYIDQIVTGTVSAAQMQAIGFPWSTAMVTRSRHSVGATIAAMRAVLEPASVSAQPWIAANLAGGTHHAKRNQGEGFCVFNDVAVAARLAQAERLAQEVIILDLDVHQGNGTAAILAADERILTVSLHGANNYPFAKAASDIDIALPDGSGDDVYLAALDDALLQVTAWLNGIRPRGSVLPPLVLFLAGVDPHELDRLGKLRVTTAGLATREQRVFAWAWEQGCRVALSMAGGYSRELNQTVALHLQTIKLAASWAAKPAKK